jgi:cytochrome c-type biogenesis protein
MNVTLGLAFLAGLASFLSPCVFSLVPAYIGYLSGRSIAVTESGNQNSRFQTFTHGVAFVLGFSIVFVILGVAISALGGVFSEIRYWLTRIGGIVVVIFGLHMTGLLRIPFLDYDLRPQTQVEERRSYFSSLMMGVFFSAGWSPCVGPVLGAILTLALANGSIAKGAQLLIAYSAGLAIPFLLAALGIGWVTQILRNHGQVMHYAEVVMGAIMIVVGAMLFFGVFNLLSRYGFFVNLGL